MDGAAAKPPALDASVYGVGYLCGSCGKENKIRQVRHVVNSWRKRETKRERNGGVRAAVQPTGSRVRLPGTGWCLRAGNLDAYIVLFVALHTKCRVTQSSAESADTASCTRRGQTEVRSHRTCRLGNTERRGEEATRFLSV